MTLLDYAPVWMTIDTHRHEVYSAPVPTGRCLLICTHAAAARDAQAAKFREMFG